jgi:hypothetical protein
MASQDGFRGGSFCNLRGDDRAKSASSAGSLSGEDLAAVHNRFVFCCSGDFSDQGNLNRAG